MRYYRRTLDMFLLRDDTDLFQRALLAAFPRVTCYWESRSIRRPIKFHSMLSECPNANYTVCLPDAGWHPLVGPLDLSFTSPGIANPPHLRFSLRLSHDPYTESGAVDAAEPKRRLCSSGVDMRFAEDDAEGRTFARHVMKILRDLSTARLARYCQRTGKIVEPAEPTKSYRAGRHAVDWCLSDERRYFHGIFGSFRPAA